jgi:hypothetical protein
MIIFLVVYAWVCAMVGVWRSVGRSSGWTRNCLPTLRLCPVFLLKFKALKTQGTIQLSRFVLLIKHVWYLKHQVGYNHLHACLVELIGSQESQKLKSVWDMVLGYGRVAWLVASGDTDMKFSWEWERELGGRSWGLV